MKNQNTQTGAHYCVYEHVNKENGRRYIGMTGIDPEKRWGYGGGGYINQPFGRIIKEVGWDNFDHHIIASGLTQ